MAADEFEPHAKRRKLSIDTPIDALATFEQEDQGSPKKGLDRPISPPVTRRKSPAIAARPDVPTWSFNDVPRGTSTTPSLGFDAERATVKEEDKGKKRGVRYVPSPFQLTHIRDMAAHQNVDAVELKDILGDPLIKECWNFNYLFDIDFVMYVIWFEDQFDGCRH
jgi:tyrosyl-DNA phosphodiesterase-1